MFEALAKKAVFKMTPVERKFTTFIGDFHTPQITNYICSTLLQGRILKLPFGQLCDHS